MKNTNTESGSVSAVTTKETNLKGFSNKDVAEMSIEVLEDLLDKEKGPIRPYTDGDITHRFKEFLSKEYDPNSFVSIIDRKKGIVYAASIGGSASKKKQIESDFASGKEVDSKEYCSLCKKYMKPDNSVAVPGGVTCNGIFASCGEIPCKHFESEQQEEHAYGKGVVKEAKKKVKEFISEDDSEQILIVKINDKDAIEYFAGLEEDYDLTKLKFAFRSEGQGNGGSYRYYDTSDVVEVYAETITFMVGNSTAHKLGMDGKFKENYQKLFEVAMNNPRVNDLFNHICGSALLKPVQPINGIAINNLVPGSVDAMLKQKTTAKYDNFKKWEKAHENHENPVYNAECKIDHNESEQQKEYAYGEVIERAIQNSPWRFSPSKKWKYSYSIVTPNEDPDGSILIADKLDSAVAEHICKTHNDWRNFKMKSGEKKVKKGNLRRLKNLAWRMKTFRNAFKLIEKNNYLGFASIKLWIEQNEDDVNQWIFTKWLKNSSNYEDFMWYFNDENESYFNGLTSDEYEDMQDSLVFIDYFDLTTSTRTVVGIPAGEWDSYTFHQEYESKLFADGKDFTAALVLEKMFDFAEDYVKHNGWITAKMADKYHIDLKLVETNSNSDVLLDKMDPGTANRVRKIVEDDGSSNPKEKNLEQRVDNLEKMIKDIWQNVCADKSPAEEKDTLPMEIINKKPVIERQNCPHCRNSKDGCEFYDKGTCRGICYPTYPPQYDPCVFNKKPILERR